MFFFNCWFVRASTVDLWCKVAGIAFSVKKQGFIQPLRAFPRAALFGLFAVGCRVACVLRLCVRSFVRSRRLLVHVSGAWVSLRVSWTPLQASWAFWELWGSLGLHFGRSGGPLGSILGGLGVILGGLGVSWAPFWELWGLLGSIFGALGVSWPPYGDPWGHPWSARGPTANFSQFFMVILGPFWKSKSIKKRSHFLIDFLLRF